MRYAGVSWSAAGYEVDLIGDGGVDRRPGPAARFGRDQIDDLVTYLRGLDGRGAGVAGRTPEDRLVTVVDSTNGVLDGRLRDAGLAVYRADPWLLPARPELGSVAAHELAAAAHRDLSALARLESSGGTLSGRQAELRAGLTASQAALAAMTAAGRCLTHGARDRPEVALTFDDGPTPPYTGQILDVLERYGVCATFFCVGLHAGVHTEEIVRMREQGHGLANHTWSHPYLPDLSRPQLVAQIERTREALAEASGGAAPALFRPPYGARTPQLMSWLGELTDITIALWDVDAGDWARPGAEHITTNAVRQARPGSVILLHDGGGDRSQTVAALPALIEGLLARGFSIVPVEKLAFPSLPLTAEETR
jgi:peptidoglycan/xylan/chitin deacetylase (PgdA/CDA1 family)